MTDQIEELDTLSPEMEMEELKIQAKRIGLKVSPNIGLDTLREKVRAALSDELVEAEAEEAAEVLAESKLTPAQRRAQAKADALALVRVKITNLNPFKREWTGEVLCASNDVVGTVKKMIPFGSDKPYHVPRIILNMMQEKECQIFIPFTLPNGDKSRKGKLIKEYSIEILPPLTQAELASLAAEQAARNSID